MGLETFQFRYGENIELGPQSTQNLRKSISTLTSRVAQTFDMRFKARGAKVLSDVQNQKVDLLLSIPGDAEKTWVREFRISVFLLLDVTQSEKPSIIPRFSAEVVRSSNSIFEIEAESSEDLLSILNEAMETVRNA